MSRDQSHCTKVDSSRVSNGSTEAREIYLNLANRMTVTGTNQLWVADITFFG